jgi:hypothetical protein
MLKTSARTWFQMKRDYAATASICLHVVSWSSLRGSNPTQEPATGP